MRQNVPACFGAQVPSGNPVDNARHASQFCVHGPLQHTLFTQNVDWHSVPRLHG